MNRIVGWSERLRRGRGESPFQLSGEADDHALARRMRAAAVELRPEGRTRLKLSAGALGSVRELGAQAETLAASCSDGGAALKKLAQDARLMEACAEQARADGVRDLPACGGAARIAQVAQMLCGRGEFKLNQDRLMLALASFDEVQTLEMRELWAMPEAVRVSLSWAYLRVGGAILDIARERKRAEKWVAGDPVSLRKRTPAFFEHALRLLGEREDAPRHAELERRLLDAGATVEQTVRQAHEAEAMARMRLENLLSNKRLIDALDWQDCFEQLSGVEQELQNDPSGVYAAMEEDSRSAVRQQTAILARRMKLSEITLARHAVRAAQAAKEAGQDEVRQTVCWWLYDDEGRAALARRMDVAGVNLPRMTPDPTGRRAVLGIAILAGLMYALYLKAVHSIWFVLLGIPLAWCAAMALLGRFSPRFVKPAKLLKLKMERVPDDRRTLVVMPVLLSSAERAEGVCGQLEALGCMEKDANVQYLILGDFADADAEHMPEDGDILDCVRARIREMNRRAGRKEYLYLHRARRLLKADGRWMGRDRKRGALMDLNRLILGENGAEEAFQAEGADCERIRQCFRYVLTIDADTRFLPGAAERLIGAMAHPLNAPRMEDGLRKGYAVLQPGMEMAADACVSDFVRLFAGNGGLNTYPTSVSNFWQDVTGEGIFGGKGLYDVRAFAQALDGALPEGRILSHDLIEGTLAGAALVSDVTFYDGFPATLSSVLRRLNRWTRGDWQLLPILLGAKRYPPANRRLGAVARVRMLDNLLRSLWAPSLLGLLIQAVWLGHGSALLIGLILCYWTPLLNLFARNGRQWRRATAELAVLPATAACTVDASLRTLWRLLFTKKHLLDWVTSADAEGASGEFALPGRIAAILLLPGLLPQWIFAALALAVMFLAGPYWIRDMERQLLEPPLPIRDTAMLAELARDIWRFFETYVNAEGHFLPPDNVQIDPDVGAARRTSPTNAGLYLMSCAAARELGLIEWDAMLRRMGETLDSLEKMEKWRGHLYNWYDIDTLSPLSPRYVSSVDSGNLAAALLLCASAVKARAPKLADRMNALAQGMDFQPLYDEKRNLFCIGVDIERGRPSDAHYDLLASESRILSYAAMMLGGAPLRHWARLARTAVASEGGPALASWSGTMFEYLMPELFMHAPVNSLLGQTAVNAAAAQRAQGGRKRRPWGVSESGYYAFDLNLNYQYRAFGLRGLALGGQAQENVVAPYASILALGQDPEAVEKNIDWMQKLGWRGEYGLYEAADYLHAGPEDCPRMVRSYMAHHQGMALCALCNALTNRSLSRAFERIPEARALALLLGERPLTRARLGRFGAENPSNRRAEAKLKDDRPVRADRRIVETHLLGGAGASALVTADGMIHYQRFGVQGTRFSGDLINRSDGACVHVRLERTGEAAILGGKGVFAPGVATLQRELGPVACEMRVCVSPEDGALIKQITLRNSGRSAEGIRVADCAPVALDAQADQLAHPVFRHLFVESERIARCAVALKRRSRGDDAPCLTLVHLVSTPGTMTCETDYEKLVGRLGSTMRPDGISWRFQGTVGAVLNPCSALETLVTVEPGQEVRLHFAMGLTEPEDVRRWVERNFAETLPERALPLSAMQARAMLGFIGLEPRQGHLLQRFGALLFDGHLSPVEPRGGETLPVSREILWSLGVSGDLPVLLVRIGRREDLGCVREAIRAHEFYRALGVEADLILASEDDGGYARPVRDALSETIAFSHLNELRGAPGGVHILDWLGLTEVQRCALCRAAAADFDAAQDFYHQIHRALRPLDAPGRAATPMETGLNLLPPLRVEDGNGFGGFLADGRYAIDVLPDRVTPAPWANLLANDDFGILLTERGGGFLWNGNSRSGRLTAFANDTLYEGWGWMLYLVDEETGAFVRLLPGARPAMPYRTLYGPAETVYRFETERLSGETAVCVCPDAPELRIHVTLRKSAAGRFRLVGFVDWLMGSDARDARFLRTWTRDGACFAAGTDAHIGYFAAANARVYPGCGRTAFLGKGTIQAPEGLTGCRETCGGWVLNVPVQLRSDVPQRFDWVIGAAAQPQQAYARVRAFYGRPDYDSVRARALGEWKRHADRLRIETPDASVNRMGNGWLLHQTLASRVRGRTGLYQPGGAYGFRDQLQDMLALLPFDPRRVRDHILRCAARQFEDGDVMHWWHEPMLGVRTKIADDMLFLPYVTAKYALWTMDHSILTEPVAYLEKVEIEPGREDRFCQMRPGEVKESLHGHCMRAFRRASAVGGHGLALMGGGDWNDGMNRVGIQGRGESVWLSEFLAVCASLYAQVCPDDADRAWLLALSDRMSAAVEQYGWDGEWYLRAYHDSGAVLGGAKSPSCRIDAISQAWAVLAGLDEERCRRAMDAAWRSLVDESRGIIRLLTPPFDGEGADPGYIQGYPAGVRENGAQYTHAACWVLLALIRMGEEDRAHKALEMLLPMNHARTPEQAAEYRVEPYVVAADIYDGNHAGRGGWTWYTGSASWLYLCILEMIGFERRGSRARVNALLGPWPEASVTVRCGESSYRLISRRGAAKITLDGRDAQGEWIELRDDGEDHEAVFPERRPAVAKGETCAKSMARSAQRS